MYTPYNSTCIQFINKKRLRGYAQNYFTDRAYKVWDPPGKYVRRRHDEHWGLRKIKEEVRDTARTGSRDICVLACS